MSFLFGLVSTILVEFVVVVLFLRKDFLRVGGFVLLINLFTWPIVNFLFGVFGMGLLFWLEIGVVIVESFLIMFLFEKKYWQALVISFVANLASFTFGLLRL